MNWDPSHIWGTSLSHLPHCPSQPASITARCSLIPRTREGRAYRLLELHALQPSSFVPLGKMPLLPLHSPSGSSSHLPRLQLLPPLPPGRMPPSPTSLHRGRVGGRQHMAPFSLAWAGYFGNEKTPLPCPPLWGTPSLPSPHSPEVLRLRSVLLLRAVMW